MAKASDIVAAGRYRALRAAPYYQAKILSMVPRCVPGLGTVACTKNAIFLYDPAFVEDLNVEEMAGLWLHEASHLLLLHNDRICAGGRDPKTGNDAADLAINPGILDMGVKLPEAPNKRGLFPENFQWPRGLTLDEYYERLRQLPQDPKNNGGGGPGHGKCGSCCGNPVEGEPDENDADGRSEAEQARTNRETAEAIRDHVKKSRGKVPAWLDRWSDDMLKPAKVPWQKTLARTVRMAVNWTAGAVDHRYDGPSRRQAGLGYGMGKPVLPRLRAPIPNVAVAFDTSGSMGHAELSAGASEVDGILKTVGAKVTFCACDAAVHTLTQIQDVRQVAELLKGGGGTDFRPAFEALEKARPRPDIVIFITDGYGPAPEDPPARMRTIWLLVGSNAPKPAEWGDAIWMDNEGEG